MGTRGTVCGSGKYLKEQDPNIQVVVVDPRRTETADLADVWLPVKPGGDAYLRERTQWDSGANLLATSPGVVFAYDRNTYTNSLLRAQGVEVL